MFTILREFVGRILRRHERDKEEIRSIISRYGVMRVERMFWPMLKELVNEHRARRWRPRVRFQVWCPERLTAAIECIIAEMRPNKKRRKIEKAFHYWCEHQQEIVRDLLRGQFGQSF